MAENSSQENSSHERFVAWVLFSFFPSLNALKNLSIVFLTPSITLYALFYTKLHFNQNLAFLSHFHRDDHATNFPSNYPCDELSTRRIFRRRIFLRQIFCIPYQNRGTNQMFSIHYYVFCVIMLYQSG